MNLALRLLVACFVIVAPTVLFLGLMRGLEKLRDDALLMRLAESDEVPEDVSKAAARNVEKGPLRADGDGASSARGSGARASASDSVSGPARAGASARDSFVCSTCGEPNMVGARYCGECLAELNR